MALIEFVDEARLKDKMGSARWLQYFDDGNTGEASATAVQEVLDDANAEVQAHLLGKGFTEAHLQLIADEADPLLSRRAAEIAMGFAGERRPEWLDDKGFGPFEQLRQRALKSLKDVATAVLRLSSEAEAGKNTQVGGQLSKNQSPSGHFVFAPTAEHRSRGSRGPGGF